MPSRPPALQASIDRLAIGSATLQAELASLDQVLDQGLGLLEDGHGICHVHRHLPVGARLQALDSSFNEFFAARSNCRNVVVGAASADGGVIVDLANYFGISPGLANAYSLAQGGSGGHASNHPPRPGDREAEAGEE